MNSWLPMYRSRRLPGLAHVTQPFHPRLHHDLRHPAQYSRLINPPLNKGTERLLIESRLSISEIAFQTGFSSQSHLTNAMMRYKQYDARKIRTSAN